LHGGGLAVTRDAGIAVTATWIAPCEWASIYSIGLSEMGRLQEEFAVRYPEAHPQVECMRPDQLKSKAALTSSTGG
jgi:hypothetical protein